MAHELDHSAIFELTGTTHVPRFSDNTMSKEKTIEQEGRSVAEAERKIHHAMPQHYAVVSKEILADGIAVETMEVVSEFSMAEAHLMARAKLVGGARILRIEESKGGEVGNMIVVAGCEMDAKRQVEMSVGQKVLFQKIAIVSKGGTGFLGFGVKPSTFECTFCSLPRVRISYTMRPRVRAIIRPDCQDVADEEKHHWKGCRCVACERTRDRGHLWVGCKCEVCGKGKDYGHVWYKNECPATCRICGKTVLHILKGCRCEICGKEEHTWRTTEKAGLMKCVRCGRLENWRSTYF